MGIEGAGRVLRKMAIAVAIAGGGAFGVWILGIGHCGTGSYRTGDIAGLTGCRIASSIAAYVIDTVVRATLIGAAAALAIAELAGTLAVTFEFASAFPIRFPIRICIVGYIAAITVILRT